MNKKNIIINELIKRNLLNNDLIKNIYNCQFNYVETETTYRFAFSYNYKIFNGHINKNIIKNKTRKHKLEKY